MPKRLIISMGNTQNVWVLNHDIPELTVFDPPLTSPQATPNRALWTDDNGRIICSARKTSPTVFHHYHYDPEISETSWAEKAASGGAVWDYDGTDYNNVWSCAGDGHVIQQFDGTLWTTDVTLSSARLLQIAVTGTGLDEVFCAGTNHVWFRLSGAIGSGTWVDHRAQLLADTGLDISGSVPDCEGVWAANKNEVYWLISSNAGPNRTWIVKWTGPWPGTFAIISNALVSNYGISDTSFDAVSPTHMWFMYADPSWGQFRFVKFDGVNINWQSPVEHNMDFGCKPLLVSESEGWAAGAYSGPERIAVWRGDGTINGWTLFHTHTVGLASGAVGIALWTESLPPVLSNENPAPNDTGVTIETNVSFDITDPDDDIDAYSVIIAVDGNTVWEAEIEQSDRYDVSVTPITDGYRYTINPNVNFLPYSDIAVEVEAYDVRGNYLDEYYSFLTMDTEPPEIINRFPAPGTTDVEYDAYISVDIFDRKSGVDFSSIEIQVDSQTAYDGYFFSPYNGSLSAVTPTVVDGYDGYNIVLDRTTRFTSESEVLVEVFATNKDGY